MKNQTTTNPMTEILSATPEQIMEAYTHEQLAETYLELMDIIREQEEQLEQLFTHAKSLELEKNVLQTMVEKI